MVKIVIDTLGSDKGSEVLTLGAYNALQEFKDLFVTLVGPESVIKNKLEELKADFSRVKIINAEDTITNYDHPVKALFEKPNASIVQAMKEVGKDEEGYIGMISAGSTGAVLMGSFRFLSSDGKTRPCLAATLPNEKGTLTCLVDAGATIDATSGQLHEFARLGRDLMKQLYHIENPSVGLLSNGAEPTKGNALVKEVHELLKNDETLNFVGNFEGTTALSGGCDVLVADGFAGNLVLKVSEGMAKRIMHDIGRFYKKTGNPAYGELLQYLMGIYDFNSLGGGVVLGTKKIIVKAHGASDEKSIVGTSRMLVNAASGEAFLK